MFHTPAGDLGKTLETLQQHAGAVNDLHVYDPNATIWTDLADFVGTPPSPRAWMGFVATGGKLFVQDGDTGDGWIHHEKSSFFEFFSSYSMAAGSPEDFFSFDLSLSEWAPVAVAQGPVPTARLSEATL